MVYTVTSQIPQFTAHFFHQSWHFKYFQNIISKENTPLKKSLEENLATKKTGNIIGDKTDCM